MRIHADPDPQPWFTHDDSLLLSKSDITGNKKCTKFAQQNFSGSVSQWERSNLELTVGPGSCLRTSIKVLGQESVGEDN